MITTIPEMTHPFGQHWDQPDRSEILLDDTHALMTVKTFKGLHEYSASQPSGVYEGKMWRRHDGAFDYEFIARGGKPVWQLCWFDSVPNNPDVCCTMRRRIILV